MPFILSASNSDLTEVSAFGLFQPLHCCLFVVFFSFSFYCRLSLVGPVLDPNLRSGTRDRPICYSHIKLITFAYGSEAVSVELKRKARSNSEPYRDLRYIEKNKCEGLSG